MCAFNSTRRKRLGCSGVSSLEFALIALPFMWLMFGIFDLARYLFIVQALVTLMTDVQRFVFVAGENVAVQQYQGPIAYTNGHASVVVPPPLDPTQGTLSVTYLNLAGGFGVNQVQVTLNYPFTAMTPGFALLDGTIQEQATYSY
jgi:Flp pilus assembly protein TadG